MREFVIKVSLFLALLVTLRMALSASVPRYWGNEVLVQKMNYFNSLEGQINTLFLGSSRTYRHFNANQINKKLGKSGVKSFNLGAPGTMLGELYNLYNKIIESRNSRSDRMLIFMEVTPIHRLKSGEEATTRGKYYLTSKIFSLITDLIQETDAFTSPEKARLHNKYSKAFTSRSIGIGMFKGILNFQIHQRILPLLSNNSKLSLIPDELQRNGGFLPLTLDTNSLSKTFRDRRMYLLNHPEIVEERLLAIKNLEYFGSPSTVSETHLKYALELIEVSRQKNIHLVFVLSPLMTSEHYNEVFSFFNSLPDSHKLNLAHISDVADLYQMKYFFDVGHLNSSGAEKLTDIFANKIQEKFTNQLNVLKKFPTEFNGYD